MGNEAVLLRERGTGLWGTERLTAEMAKLGRDIETYWLETEISRYRAQRNQTNSPWSWDLRQLERRAENEAACIYGNLNSMSGALERVQQMPGTAEKASR